VLVTEHISCAKWCFLPGAAAAAGQNAHAAVPKMVYVGMPTLNWKNLATPLGIILGKSLKKN